MFVFSNEHHNFAVLTVAVYVGLPWLAIIRYVLKGSEKLMDRIFQIIAVCLAGLAGYFLWSRNTDAAFVAAVLGCVSFLLSVRFQVKERNRIREEERVNAEPDHSPDSDQPHL